MQKKSPSIKVGWWNIVELINILLSHFFFLRNDFALRFVAFCAEKSRVIIIRNGEENGRGDECVLIRLEFVLIGWLN